MKLFFLILIFISCGKHKSLKEKSSDVTLNQNCKTFCENKDLFFIPIDSFQTLSFPNFGYRGIGRCRGHALLTQKFLYLARYDYSAACLNESCVEYNLKGIDAIIHDEAFVFKGVRNLYELSQNNRINTKLRSIVAGTSNRYTALEANIRVTDRNSEHANIFSEILLRLENNEKSYIGVHGKQTGHHAILSFYSSWKNDLEVICVIDPNIVSTHFSCENYLYENDGDIYYKRYDREPDKLFKFKLTQDEDMRTSSYHNSLFQACLSYSSDQNLCFIEN